MKMNLEELLKNREIYRMENAKELAPKALRIAERDLKTAKHLFEKENYDWCLAIAYNAMLQAGRALMFHMGYRPSSSHGHIAVIKFLHAVKGKEISDKLILFLDRARKKRHRIVYEESEIISESEAEECLKWAEEFVKKVKSLLKV